MDKDLKDIITYCGGAILVYCTFIGATAYFIKETRLIIIYVLILTIFLWLGYIQIKINKSHTGGKNE